MKKDTNSVRQNIILYLRILFGPGSGSGVGSIRSIGSLNEFKNGYIVEWRSLIEADEVE